MAKVTGPIHSDSASGKLADAMVFAVWKGVKYVRQYVIPANPQSSDQGDQRIIMGGTAARLVKFPYPERLTRSWRLLMLSRQDKASSPI